MPPIKKDPRVSQILFLLSLLIFGIASRDFSLALVTGFGVLCVALMVQWAGQRILMQPKSYSSAIISSLSILILLRSEQTAPLLLAALLAIGSKFVLRWGGKHFFNPSCFGIVATLLLSDQVWLSPAQWGQGTLLALWTMLVGLAVLSRVGRFDVSLIFMAVYTLLLLGRVIYLGQELAVLWHQLQTGSLLIFTFFMISDPRSTPNHPFGRFLFAAIVAGVAYYLRFFEYNANGLMLALFLVSPITIILDSLWQHSRFDWKNRKESGSHELSSRTRVPGVFSLVPTNFRLLWFLRRQGRRQSL